MTDPRVVPIAEYDLAELRHHWGDFYRIERDADGRYRAYRRNDTGAPFRADTTDLMFAALRADYAAARAQQPESDARPE